MHNIFSVCPCFNAYDYEGVADLSYIDPWLIYIVFFFLFLFFFRILAFHLPSHDSFFFFFLNLSFLVLFSAVTLILCRTKGVSGVCLESF